MKQFNPFRVEKKKIQKMGTSKGLVIPFQDLKNCNLNAGDEVSFIVEPVNAKYKFKDLLAIQSKLDKLNTFIFESINKLSSINIEKTSDILNSVTESIDMFIEALDEVLQI